MEILQVGLSIFLLITIVRVYINWFSIRSEEDYNSSRRKSLQRQIDHLTLLPELNRQIEIYEELGGDLICTPVSRGVSVLLPEGRRESPFYFDTDDCSLSEFREKYILPLLLDEEK